jgi:hypothetical protein
VTHLLALWRAIGATPRHPLPPPFPFALEPSQSAPMSRKTPCYTGHMGTNILTVAIGLSDQDLLARIQALAGTERTATAELVAHLAALELRPSLYLSRGYGSLFDYCTQALGMSEDTACNRIHVTRVCRLFPVILDRLAAGALTLSALRMLGPHLTAENHEAVLARAANRRRGEIEALVAELAPKPDVVASVRKLPVPKQMGTSQAGPEGRVAESLLPPSPPSAALSGTDEMFAAALPTPQDTAAFTETYLAPLPRTQWPIITASAPSRYRVQFTIGQKAHDKLRRLQSLLRREIPNGDPGIIFERMLDLYLEKVEKAKLGETNRPRVSSPADGPRETQADGAYGIRIRRAADQSSDPKQSRHIPNAVKRVVWRRDGGQCAFVAETGRRCGERAFLELHHIHPYALDGAAAVDNISLRCRRHNAYEAEVIFGPRVAESKQPVLPIDD